MQDETLSFRHDLARRAVEDDVSPARRRDLDRRVLAALERAGHDDPARLAHHARRAGDYDAIRRHAPAAARAASAAATARRSSNGRRRWPSAPVRRRSRVWRSRPTCAGGRSGRSRRAAR